jgi:hypothetical protein
MRTRWIVAAFVIGMAIALWDASHIEGFITAFGCLFMIAARRLEGAIVELRQTLRIGSIGISLYDEALNRSLRPVATEDQKETA